MSEEEISRMVREAEEHAEEDRLVKEKTDAKYALESYVYGLKAQCEDLEESTGAELAVEDREELEEAIAADGLNPEPYRVRGVIHEERGRPRLVFDALL